MVSAFNSFDHTGLNAFAGTPFNARGEFPCPSFAKIVVSGITKCACTGGTNVDYGLSFAGGTFYLPLNFLSTPTISNCSFLQVYGGNFGTHRTYNSSPCAAGLVSESVYDELLVSVVYRPTTNRIRAITISTIGPSTSVFEYGPTGTALPGDTINNTYTSLCAPGRSAYGGTAVVTFL